MKRIAALIITGLGFIGLAACSSSSNNSASNPQSWCWQWRGSSDGSAVVGNSIGQVSCNTRDTANLIPPSGSSYTYSLLNHTRGYTAHGVPAHGGLACSSVSTDPKNPGGWRVYVGTSGYDAAQDLCNQLQQTTPEDGFQFSSTGLINKLQSQAQAQQAQASAQAAQQQVQTDLSNAEQGDQISDYTSSLAKYRQDLANNCQAALADSGDFSDGSIVSSEENAIDALENDLSNDANPSADSNIKREITKATAAVNQVISQANVMINQANANASQNPDIVPCGLGTWPPFTPTAGEE